MQRSRKGAGKLSSWRQASRALTRREWRTVAGMGSVVIGLHVVGFFILIAVVAPHRYQLGSSGAFTVGLGLTAYTLGLRHALDADHIAAIDNATRKLMAERKRPLGVGFFFSLGHSSIVFVLALLGAVPQAPVLIALALLGAMLGFAPFNRPVAKLFLGDGGSLPIGLVLAWLLLQLAGNGHLAAALLLPLYYVADATITLLRRMARGERITQAHRSHFYQVATTRGLSVMDVVRRVFAANVVLAWLAVVTVLFDSTVFDVIALLLGAAEVALLLRAMARGR